ncbi:hypothetical protein OSB04_032101 [Centaurea solstitialis]|uniref:Reverse transcriptase n=1 Tax=Centaurea solstitialis TaxID=347529 RepID=A0AA38SBP6_9ASTR|nr:hypothetical protein OSB04_032101 [Centaurea solstitialis]
MVGIDPNVISHKLNVDPTFKPIKQKRRKFAPESNKVINDEVENLLKTGKIREVKYPEWLANVVVVQKKIQAIILNHEVCSKLTSSLLTILCDHLYFTFDSIVISLVIWRVCIDFTDLNKACPKDPFPLPHIHAMVDATAGHELLTFMDTYSGYNQILMHTDDQEKTAFMTDKCIYCYKVMPFGLKNAGSTYQRLVNMMFKEHLGRTMQVYIDDMLVKSERSIDHVAHLKQSFDILRQYKMKLNPTKCSFGVRAGKFLGYLVTQRGIEASPEQVKAITEIQSPRNIKEVQKLTGRVAALTRFISRSSDKCHLFYNVLRKNQGFLWTDEFNQEFKSPRILLKKLWKNTLTTNGTLNNERNHKMLQTVICFSDRYLEEGFMKVQIDTVRDGCEEYDLPVHIPNSDVQKLGQAIENFIQWEICSVELNHSSLLVIRPKRTLIYVLDSITSEKTAEAYKIKNVIDKAITEYNHAIGSCQVNMFAQITWKLQKSNVPKLTDDYQLKEINLDSTHLDHKVYIGKSLEPDTREQLISFLQEHADCFSWIHEDMVDATAVYELLTFMDAYSGYNQMHEDDQVKAAFMTNKGLKQYMMSPPNLAKLQRDDIFQLYIAVSPTVVSVVLTREEDKQQQPIYYISKSLLDAETRYTSIEKLVLGLLTAAKKLRHYFESHHISIITNYPLKSVLRKPELSGRLAKWSIYLSGYDIEYKSRLAIKSQVLADFVADFSPELEQEAHAKVIIMINQDDTFWEMNVHDSSNIRGSGLGIVLKSPQGDNLAYSIRCDFKTTNNKAEYEALIA